MKIYYLKDVTITLDTTTDGASGTYTYATPVGPYEVQTYITEGLDAGKVTLHIDKPGTDETISILFTDCYESLTAAQNAAKIANATVVNQAKSAIAKLSKIK